MCTLSQPKCADDSCKAKQAVTLLSSMYRNNVNWDVKLTNWWKAPYLYREHAQRQTAYSSHHCQMPPSISTRRKPITRHHHFVALSFCWVKHAASGGQVCWAVRITFDSIISVCYQNPGFCPKRSVRLINIYTYFSKIQVH